MVAGGWCRWLWGLHCTPMLKLRVALLRLILLIISGGEATRSLGEGWWA